MKQLITLVAIFTYSFCQAQPASTFLTSKVSVGRTTAGDTISALSFDLGQILLYDVNTAGGQIVTISKELKAKGKAQLMTLWDISLKKPLWTIELKDPSLDLVLTEHGIFRYDGKRTVCHSRTNGIAVWAKKDKLAGLRENRGLIVSQNGDVINIESGTKIINTQTEHKYGVNEVLPVSNNTLVIAADGLFGVNTTTRKHWGFPSKTGWNYHGGQRNDAVNTSVVLVSALAFGVVGGIAAAAATGQLGNSNAATIANKGNSNILLENNTAYFASLENMISVDTRSGEKKFETALPGARTSSSLMRADDSYVYLLNLGYVATDKGTNLYCGHPFFASYNKATGMQNYLDSLGPKGAVAAANYIGDTVFVNYNNKYITATELRTGRRILTGEIKAGGLPQVVLFMDPKQYYVERKGGVFTSLHDEYAGLVFMEDKENFIYTYNLKTKKTERFSRTPWHAMDVKGKTVMYNDKALTILKSGKNFAVLDLENPIVTGNTAVGINKSNVKLADIKMLLN